jgi:hypothetical protein
VALATSDWPTFNLNFFFLKKKKLGMEAFWGKKRNQNGQIAKI